MPPIGKHLTEAQRQSLKSAILANPSAMTRDIAKALGINETTVGRMRRELRSAQPETLTLPEIPAAEVRDATFWKRRAAEEQKRADEAEHVCREMAGVFSRHIDVPNWTLPSDDGKPGRAVGLIHLSDLHVGEVVRAEEIGGFNEYDPDVFRRRLRRMIAAATQILPRWASDTTMSGVVIALNGDLISGDIHDELRRTNALTAHQQVALATEELAAGIRVIADTFGAAMVTVTPGNHGRSTEKTHAKRMAALSYDIMIGNILAREFASDERVTVNVASGADIVFPLYRWSILQTHGDSMGTGGGQGFAGPELPIVRGGKRIKLAGFATGERYDIILTAHYHTSSNPGTILANGSVVGYSEYSQRIRATPEPPMQWLALVHERWGLRERVPVVLEDPRQPERPRVRVPAGMAA